MRLVLMVKNALLFEDMDNKTLTNGSNMTRSGPKKDDSLAQDKIRIIRGIEMGDGKSPQVN